MDALSSLTRHPNERPTHPVDLSLAPQKIRTRRIRSTTPGASYDRILRKKPDVPIRARRIRSNRANASYDRIGRPVKPEPESSPARAIEPNSPKSLFSGYLMRTRIRIGMTFSFSG
jgi:hypothetical protein